MVVLRRDVRNIGEPFMQQIFYTPPIETLWAEGFPRLEASLCQNSQLMIEHKGDVYQMDRSKSLIVLECFRFPASVFQRRHSSYFHTEGLGRSYNPILSLLCWGGGECFGEGNQFDGWCAMAALWPAAAAVVVVASSKAWLLNLYNIIFIHVSYRYIQSIPHAQTLGIMQQYSEIQ